MSGNKKPTIIFFTHWAHQLGGAEHSLLELLSFARKRFNCHVITTEKGKFIDMVSKMNITYHVIPCRSSIYKINRYNMLKSLLCVWYEFPGFLKYLLKLDRRIKLINPELIHANVPKSHISILLLLIFRCKVKTCLHIREIFKKNSLASILYNFLFIKSKCNIIAISKSVKHNLPSRLQNNTTVIYNGIEIKTHEKKYSDNSQIKLLYLGRIVPWKGCHILIDIFSYLREKFPKKNIILSLVGDTLYWSSEYRTKLEDKIKKMNLSSSCHLLPHSENPESVYLNHDIFCNASYNEPFGRVIAEAQAFGLPVVAFDSGGVSEIVENKQSGFLVPYSDIKSFADAISQFVISPQLIKRMGMQGHVRAKSMFNRDYQCNTICDYLEKI